MKKALVQINIAVFLWGFTGVLGRAITLDAVQLVWWRLLVTVVALWIMFLFFQKQKLLPGAAVLPLSGIGTVQALHWVFFYASIKLANVTIALTCLSITALLAALIEPLVVKKKFDRFELLLGAFAVAGILIIYQTHIQFSIGIVVGLISALLTVLVSVFNKKIIDRYDPAAITLYQLSGGFVGLTLMIPLFLKFFNTGMQLPARTDWVWLVILALICTIVTFFLYIRSLKHLSAFTVNLVLTLEPVYGILLAFAIYKENQALSNWFYPGFALIAVAVIFHTSRMLRNRTESITLPGDLIQ